MADFGEEEDVYEQPDDYTATTIATNLNQKKESKPEGKDGNVYYSIKEGKIGVQKSVTSYHDEPQKSASAGWDQSRVIIIAVISCLLCIVASVVFTYLYNNQIKFVSAADTRICPCFTNNNVKECFCYNCSSPENKLDCSIGKLIDGGCNLECDHFCVRYINENKTVCACRPGYSLKANNTCMDINECSGNHRCDQKCVNTAGSYTCVCDAGYEMDPSSHTCVSKDECSLGTHGCSHICINTLGSYLCSCQHGYSLGKDGRSCLRCPEKFRTVDQNCYMFVSEMLTWDESRARCKDEGTDLLSIETLEEEYYLKSAVRTGYLSLHGSSIWLGLSDKTSEGQYMWVNNEAASNFTEWGYGEPIPDYPDTALDCVLLDLSSWKWHMNPCGTKRAFMCEVSAIH